MVESSHKQGGYGMHKDRGRVSEPSRANGDTRATKPRTDSMPETRPGGRTTGPPYSTIDATRGGLS